MITLTILVVLFIALVVVGIAAALGLIAGVGVVLLPIIDVVICVAIIVGLIKLFRRN